MNSALLSDFNPGAVAIYHDNLGVYTVTTDKVTLYLHSGPKDINISKTIDRVVDVKVVQINDSACFIVFIFGQNSVSLSGVHG